MSADGDTGPALIRSHLFAPADPRQWWAPCGTCGLGAPAHAGTAVALTPTPEELKTYRCPNCVTQGRVTCSHGR